MSEPKAPGRPSVGFVIVLAICAAAPTVGDVGGCQDAAKPLDANKFFAARLQLECDRCKECELSTAMCKRACDPRTRVPSSFPEGCRPLEHDGQVCLRALEAASCDEFEGVVAPSPVVPTECDFCPESGP
ncbi:MAG: hypothetical protein HYV09_26465 [Deltaproteobacteria bacterium]|nr:hypothetical protein [Deltaproteobacteria bacterium]